jgi:hypothetical protein
MIAMLNEAALDDLGSRSAATHRSCSLVLAIIVFTVAGLHERPTALGRIPTPSMVPAFRGF